MTGPELAGAKLARRLQLVVAVAHLHRARVHRHWTSQHHLGPLEGKEGGERKMDLGAKASRAPVVSVGVVARGASSRDSVTMLQGLLT